MLEHGGNLVLAAEKYGIPLNDWLDLSTGINPHGYPIPEIPAVLWQRLPEVEDSLITAAQTYYGCRHALPSSGSQAALQALPRLLPVCKVAILSPMYAEHALAWVRCGHEIIRFTSLDDLQTIQDAKVILLSNPNNPTAEKFPVETLLELHKKQTGKGGWLVIDEAFMDATPEWSLTPYAHLPGLVVLRSLGKFFGLAGARVGFVMAEKGLLNKLEEILGPWPLTGPARFIAGQALADTTWQEKTRIQLHEASNKLALLLEKNGLPPYARTTLFQWVPARHWNAWHTHLAKHGIWTRKFDKIKALRFGLPPNDGWSRLESALRVFSG